jgi:GAF domain-containing protein
MEDRLLAAAAMGAFAPDEVARELVQSIVDVARTIFSARAATIFLLDRETNELVFEAVAGAGGGLIGRRLPSDTGIAGWVLVTRQPLVIEELANDPRFAKDVAEDVGYVPEGLMAVPLVRDDNPLGVLEVLDRPRRPEFSLDELELLSMFARQAAIALDVLQRARTARQALEGSEDAGVVARLASTVLAHEHRRGDALQLLAALDRLLANQASSPEEAD